MANVEAEIKAQRCPYLGASVLYHDPVSQEACAAIVCNVNDSGTVNLVFFGRECQYCSARDVRQGTGQFDSWSWPGTER